VPEGIVMKWPSKKQREGLEIKGFIRSYKTIHPNTEFEIVKRREKPDYFVIDKRSSRKFGVKLTSVYYNDRSVPEEHIAPINLELTTVGIPYNHHEVEEYKRRLIEAIKSKVKKARNNYDLAYLLLLSIHVNKHRAIFIDTRQEWDKLVDDNEEVFDNMEPFKEIVFWNLANGGVFCVKPGRKTGEK